MLIKYLFSINGHYVNPSYKQDLAKEYTLENGQHFFREGLSGNIKLLKDDFDWLYAQSTETELDLLIEKSNDNGLSWSDYYTGVFYKTNCKFNEDDKIAEISVDTKDRYTEVLAGIDNEYNLIKLAPARTPLIYRKRPLIQIYIPGEDVVACFLSGNSWEQDVTEATTNETLITDTYKFTKVSVINVCNIVPHEYPPTPPVFILPNVAGDYVGEGEWASGVTFTMRSPTGAYGFRYRYPGGGATAYYLEIYRVSDGVVLFDRAISLSNSPFNTTYFLEAVSGSGASGGYDVYWSRRNVYGRYLLDLDEVPSFSLVSAPIPVNDLVADNRNYQYVLGYAIDGITVTNQTTSTPTEYGLAENGEYYQEPYSIFGDVFYPLAKSTWTTASIWFNFTIYDPIFEVACRKEYTMKDTSMLADVIKVLLAEIDPTLTHSGASDYSQVLYGSNPIGASMRLMITQKSNVLTGEYDKPAQKAPITLSSVLSMLANCFRIYWFIDDANRFRLEHISWFKNGGSYSTSPVLGFDLTVMEQLKNKKKWGFATSSIEYDKESLPERYEFAWMDEVTLSFEGYPIVINSKYIQRGKKEDIAIADFTTDIDYMLLNPEAVSSDGFALFGAILVSGNYEVPFVTLDAAGIEYIAQNGYLSWIYLAATYWTRDLPAYDININEADSYALGIQRRKKQKVTFPSANDPDPVKLIKTYIGDGQIEKISINLSSRLIEADLRYDTE